MEKMSIANIIITIIILGIFFSCFVGLWVSASRVIAAEPEEEPVVIYLTEEELAERPLVVPETEEAVEPVECNEETFKYFEDIPLDKKIQFFTQELCNEYGVSYGFFIAMLESESTFNKDAIGDNGKSLGYMQINKPNWDRYDLDASMVYDNLEIGIRMLGELIEKYSEFDDVVMAYKAGESALKSFKEKGIRLNACDVIAERTLYWNQIIEK